MMQHQRSSPSQRLIKIIYQLVVYSMLMSLALACGSTTDNTGNDSAAGTSGTGSTGTETQGSEDSSQAVVNVVMHIENTQSPNVGALISAIDALGDAGIPLSLGADMGWINTEPRAAEVFSHIVQWDGALDVHYHYSAGYNRADLASKISILGYTPTNVVSGYTSAEIDALQSTISPQLFGASWQAQYLWGQSEPGHTSEDTSWGITLSETDGPLIIGNGQHTIASAQAMIDLVNANSYPGYLLTSAIMLDPITLTVVDEDENGYAQIIEFKNSADGQATTWLTLQATGELAESDYAGLDSRVESSSGN